jgi:hypothetical protein
MASLNYYLGTLAVNLVAGRNSFNAYLLLGSGGAPVEDEEDGLRV